MSDKMTKNKQTKGFEYQPYEKLTKIHKKNRKGRTNINNRKTKEMECPNLPIERGITTDINPLTMIVTMTQTISIKRNPRNQLVQKR